MRRCAGPSAGYVDGVFDGRWAPGQALGLAGDLLGDEPDGYLAVEGGVEGFRDLGP